MKKSFKTILILAIILVILVVPAVYLWEAVFHQSGQTAEFIVKEGEGTREIAQNLKTQKLIFSPLVFSFLIYQKHWYLQAGNYQISPQMNMLDIIEVLRGGDEFSLTIPEGWRATQIDEALAKKKILNAGEFLQVASSNEGYLFPDTYRFAPNMTAVQIRDMMLDNFQKKTAGQNVTPQVLIIASIVEREAKFDEDRPKIAGVYWNRLEKGMKLEADPTIQYGKGSWEPITAADYKNFQSPYNTYLHDGLPPGPICNPGLKSIEATLYPQKDGWLYFFHKTDGHAVYSQTLEDHQAKVKAQ